MIVIKCIAPMEDSGQSNEQANNLINIDYLEDEVLALIAQIIVDYLLKAEK